MLFNVAALIGLINVILLAEGSRGATIDSKNIEKTVKDQNNCTTAEVFLQSKHFKRCAGVQISSTPHPWIRRNQGLDLCKALNDEITHVCWEMDSAFKINDTFLTNLTSLIGILDENIAKTKYDVITICNTFVSELQWDEEMCRESCFNPITKSLDSLCLGLFFLINRGVTNMTSDADISPDDSEYIGMEFSQLDIYFLEDDNNDTYDDIEFLEREENMLPIPGNSNDDELRLFGYLTLSQFLAFFAICVVACLVYHHRQLKKMKEELSFRNKNALLVPQDGFSNLSSLKPAFSI